MIAALLILLGCWVYCILAITASVRHANQKVAAGAVEPSAISILKPLAGLDEGLEQNLRSYFEQQYSPYELLFAMRVPSDPAYGLVQRLIAEYPNVRARLILTGEPPYPHAKVHSLQCMLDEAQNELIVMSDSDVRVDFDFCRKLAEEFSDPKLHLVTCPYRAVAGDSIWSRLEAVGMNTDFHAGLFTAVMTEGAAKFAVGPTIVTRKRVMERLGGMKRVKDYLAEDFMLGRLASEAGFTVKLSPYVVEHRIGSESMTSNFSHRIRWARMARRYRPLGYVGQFFTCLLPINVCLVAVFPSLWPSLLLTFTLRAILAYQVSWRILSARVPWGLLVVQDILHFAFWIAGFFGNSIQWRGRRYLLNRDGTVQPSG